MRFLSLTLALGLISAPTMADDVDLANGEKLHNENCVSCHQSMFEGDGSSIYTREDRRVIDSDKLSNQVQRCSLNLRLDWFDSEINDVSAYLDQQFYKFSTETHETQKTEPKVTKDTKN